MGRLTLICLLAVSLCCLPVMAVAGGYLLSLDGRQQFAVAITVRGAQMTGLCIIRTDEARSRGAIVNEFGVHVLDFTLSADRRKVKLLNVMPAMDRWYVRKVVRSDLRMLFGATEVPREKGRRSLAVEDDGSVTLENKRHELKYSLKPIPNTEEDETEE